MPTRASTPHVVILTRNTFDPLDRVLTSLGVVQDVRKTTSPTKAVSNLVQALEQGAAPLVWADVCSMPYNTNHQVEGY
ncbi:MAG: hypothetical protein EXR52_02520 [Dehalococcoidia bacterium]|nr:hypothetical protein [Dehalococcoidia bacterium]